MKNFLNEFKNFAMKGNVMDMAVGVIIGAAFGKIVTSIVNDIVMPLLGLVVGQGTFKDLVIEIDNGYGIKAKVMYGSFLQTVLDFLIIAFSIFVFVKIMNKTRSKIESITSKNKIEEEKKVEEASIEVKLLTEIRDLLKESSK